MRRSTRIVLLIELTASSALVLALALAALLQSRLLVRGEARDLLIGDLRKMRSDLEV